MKTQHPAPAKVSPESDAKRCAIDVKPAAIPGRKLVLPAKGIDVSIPARTITVEYEETILRVRAPYKIVSE